MILCSAEPRIISCLPTHVINLVINDNSLEILYIYNIQKALKIDFQSSKLVDMIQATNDQDAMGSGLRCTSPKHDLWKFT